MPGDLTERCDWSLLHSRAFIYHHKCINGHVRVKLYQQVLELKNVCEYKHS